MHTGLKARFRLQHYYLPEINVNNQAKQQGLTKSAGLMGPDLVGDPCRPAPSGLENRITGWGRPVWWMRVRTETEDEDTAKLTPTLLARVSLQYLTQETFVEALPWHVFAMTTPIFQQKPDCLCTETALTEGFILNINAIIIFYSNCRKWTWSPYLELI